VFGQDTVRQKVEELITSNATCVPSNPSRSVDVGLIQARRQLGKPAFAEWAPLRENTGAPFVPSAYVTDTIVTGDGAGSFASVAATPATFGAWMVVVLAPVLRHQDKPFGYYNDYKA